MVGRETKNFFNTVRKGLKIIKSCYTTSTLKVCENKVDWKTKEYDCVDLFRSYPISVSVEPTPKGVNQKAIVINSSVLTDYIPS